MVTTLADLVQKFPVPFTFQVERRWTFMLVAVVLLAVAASAVAGVVVRPSLSMGRSSLLAAVVGEVLVLAVLLEAMPAELVQVVDVINAGAAVEEEVAHRLPVATVGAAIGANQMGEKEATMALVEMLAKRMEHRADGASKTVDTLPITRETEAVAAAALVTAVVAAAVRDAMEVREGVVHPLQPTIYKKPCSQ